MSKKILIIGGSSSIGRYIRNYLKDADYTYYNNSLRGGIYYDIKQRNIEDVVELQDYSNVIILSSISKLDDCINNKTLSDEINIEATKVLIDTLSKYNVKVIYFSSEFVFDGTKGNYSENDATNPINVYGNQKLAIENYIQRNTSNYCILRIAKTYSSSFNDRSLLANWYDCIVKKNISEIKCFADQAFSPLYVNDLCLILNSIIDINLIGIINVGGPSKHTRLDCLRYFLRAFGWGDRVNVIETTLSTIESNDNWPKDVSFNVSKLNNIFTFNLTSIEYVCRKMKERHEKIIRAS